MLAFIPDTWKKNFYSIFIAQLFVQVSFNFVYPFMSLFVQELGNYTNREAAFWAGIVTGVRGLGLFASAPLWGIVADRWGRKNMILRAHFGSALILGLMSFAPNLPTLIVLNLFQGLLSGSAAVAAAFVASSTPKKDLPFALGMLLVVTYSSTAIGPLTGGFIADHFGYRDSFLISSLLHIVGGVIVILMVKEKFERSAQASPASISTLFRLAGSRQMLPLLLTLCVLQAGPPMVSPIIPLFIRDLSPEGAVAASAGLALFLMGSLSALSSVTSGRLGRIYSVKVILIICCIGTGLFYLLPTRAVSVPQLIIFVAMIGIFAGGIITSVNTLISKSAQSGHQGMAFGMASSAQSLGNAIGPLIGGTVTSAFGFRSVFWVAGGIFIGMGLIIARFIMRSEKLVKSTLS
jgi:MFS transporter, DHA1 family, multidrug resistance protein